MPGSKKAPDTSPEQMLKNNKVILQLLDKNRKQGLERLDKACKDLEDMHYVASEPDLEKRLRSIEAAIRSTATTLEALSGLFDVVVQDFMQMVGTADRNFEATMYQGLHLQTLLKALADKGILSEKELESYWKTVLAENGLEAKTDSEPQPQ